MGVILHYSVGVITSGAALGDNKREEAGEGGGETMERILIPSSVSGNGVNVTRVFLRGVTSEMVYDGT